MGDARAQKQKDKASDDRAKCDTRAAEGQRGRAAASSRCRARTHAAASALRVRKRAADKDAGLTAPVATQLRHVRLALARARAREGASALGLSGAAVAALCLRTRSARRDSPVTPAGRSVSSLLLSRRAPSISARRRARLPLRSARVLRAGGGRRRAPGRRRSAASKANALSPLVAVVKTACHSNRLASCITCLSYKKDAQQMVACAKSSVNGMNGASLAL